ncbi:hypothetical protein [Oleiharenicola lentus]|uniref:hypothetical protein n=1 Tax=Oleiharenicola lentus TaxID=2508720 RepID=UPI003F66D8C2
MNSLLSFSATKIICSFALALVAPVAVLTAQVPNGDFSSTTNVGSIGGGLITGNITETAGSGPWSMETHGVIGLLVAPRVTIGSGIARISGLTDLNVLGVGLLNNSASVFNNDIGSTYAANTTYTLKADFSSASVLSAALLTNAGTGIALRANGTQVATTLGSLTSVSLLSANSGQFTLNFSTASNLVGRNVGIELFAGRGSGLADLSLLGGVRFDNVTLNSVGGAAAIPEPADVALMIGAAGLAGVIAMRVRRQRHAALVTAATA